MDINNTIALDIPKEDETIIADNYLTSLFKWIALWAIATVAFIWIINPYGVSPVQINLPGINTQKPKRLDIDRLIKPIEVWRYQPKTILLGTSRIHESIDPTVFNNSPYAPAYNAAIPASTLAENADHIEQYLKLDTNVKDIFIELFLYNFTGQAQVSTPKTWEQFFRNLASLEISFDALIDSIKTIYANKQEGPITAHIAKEGYWIPSSDFNPATTFSDAINIQTVISWDRAAKMSLQADAFKSLDRIVNLARDHGIKLHMLLTPNYPWDDYRLMSLGYWPMLEEWMRKVAQYSDVVSFSQYNSYLEEPPTLEPKMIWWNDPTHFSLKMGRVMMNAYLGHPIKDTPKNLMRHLNPATVEAVIAERRAGALHWAATHPDFAEDFEAAKLNKDIISGTLDIKTKTLTVDDRKHPIVNGVGEVSFTTRQGSMLQASGWAIDNLKNTHVSQLVATIGSTVVARSFATVDRQDIADKYGKNTIRSGFAISIPLNTWDRSQLIRIFAVMKDGRAVQLASKDKNITGF